MSSLANQLAAEERDEVARGIRTLLARPLLTERSDPAAFDVVRRRRDPLVRWFDYTLGWPLVVEARQGYARLSKIRSYGAGAAAGRPARRLRSGRAVLDRRRYVLFCVTCAELLSSPMTTVGFLADRVVQATRADEALEAFDTARRPERMAFVDVLKLLESYGAVTAVGGATESYAETAAAKVLYRVQPEVLTRLLAAPGSPSRAASDGVPSEERLEALVRERRYGGGQDGATAAQRSLWLRHSVLRRLFDDPVLHRDELTEAQAGYLASPSGRQLMRRAAEQAGFVLEERAEGWLLADPDGIATDEKFPDDSGHAKVAALLLLDPVAHAGPAGVPADGLVERAAKLLDRFPPSWGRAYRSDGGAARLAEDAVRVLESFGLVRSEGGRTAARPAAHRYRVAGVRQHGKRQGEPRKDA